MTSLYEEVITPVFFAMKIWKNSEFCAMIKYTAGYRAFLTAVNTRKGE